MTTPFIQIENIRVFGKKGAQLTSKQIESIQPTLSTQLHMVRHFKSLPEEYLKTLKLNDEESQRLLKTKGSNFYSDLEFVSNPLAVIASVKQHTLEMANNGELFWIEKKSRKFCLFSIDYDQQVGDCGLVKISELTQELQKKIKVEKRGDAQGDNYEIKTLKHAMVPTNHVIVELFFTYDQNVEIGTAYPGIMAPDQPDKSGQSKEEYEYNCQFWEEHVFIDPTSL